MSQPELVVVQPSGSKKCVSCKEIKSNENFYKNRTRKDGLDYFCKSCKLKSNKKYFKKETFSRYMKMYHKTEKGRIHQFHSHWKSSGIKNADGSWFRWHDYQVMMAQQNGKCAICGSVRTGGRKLDVDHNHKNGIVRWLLCSPCNRLLGDAKDNPDVLEKAANLLREKNVS